ncbi:hypothetical protein [Bacillus sp. AFS037270]|uniref:hypothetical protein n=1 Tax=Bacillus sp. AFS037270 TaxID=2033499 RepID=UPI000BFD005B|nr:hypothetical protein [Bacillus sp. AFS037270]PGV55134.1 hypothetical protein COD92_02830 [Bacillus sp. AFS037270]
MSTLVEKKVNNVLNIVNSEGNIKRSHLTSVVKERKDMYFTSIFSLDDLVELVVIKGLLEKNNDILSITEKGKKFVERA